MAELALADLVLLDGKRFVTTGAAPADALLREVYDVLAEGQGRRATSQLQRIDRRVGVRRRVVDGLVEAGVLGRDPRGPLLVTAHPLLQPTVREVLVSRVRNAAAGDGTIEPRTAILLALSGPARLLEVVADKPRAHAKKRIAQATELTPLAAIVKKVIAEAAAAASVGAVAAASAGTTGS